MSPAPPEPTSSALPPAFRTNNNTEEAHSTPATSSPTLDLPKPTLRLELRDLRHPATHTFLTNVDPSKDVTVLVDTVVKLLYYPSQRSDTATPTRPHPYQPNIPGTRSITLIPRSLDGVAYTTGLDLDDDHKEIHFSLSYINHVSKTNRSSQAKIRHELMGVICHELVHCYQHNGSGTAPGGLIEGIADWVRLRAGYEAPHWKREVGDDAKWDSGYQTTGYFLDWLEKGFGEGSVRRINETLGKGKYVEKDFWSGLFGKNVNQLWDGYKEDVERSQ